MKSLTRLGTGSSPSIRIAAAKPGRAARRSYGAPLDGASRCVTKLLRRLDGFPRAMMNQRPDRPRDAWWTVQRGEGPVAAAAIHDGHGLRDEIAGLMALADAERLREEDPFTGQAILGVPTHIIAHRSRFEADLNRSADTAIYRTPEQCWGLEVWKTPLEEDVAQRSLDYHRRFYAMVAHVLDDIAAEHPRFVMLDIHSYNHRRNGPDGQPTPPDQSPEINIGTFSMPRARRSLRPHPGRIFPRSGRPGRALLRR